MPVARKSEVERMIVMPNGGSVQVRSADDPDSLRGEGLDFVVMDECAFMKEVAWTEAIRPALSDRQGRALFISTPKGRNWFWKLYQRCGYDSEWQAWKYPTVANPYIEPAEVDAAKDELPELIFEQEYLAEFLENEGAVFRNIAACMGAIPCTLPLEHRGHNLVVGVDWGKQNDFTAISVGCTTCKKEIAIDRFNKIDYHFQRKRLVALMDRFKVGSGLVETNSIGEPNLEELQRSGVWVDGFQTTATTKPPLIENLALALEKAEWQFINDPIWTGELEAYERKVSETTGRSSYSAPEGMHDDTVIARALMLRAADQGSVILFEA